MASKADRARARAQNLRRRMRERIGDGIRSGSAYGTGILYGTMEQRGTLQSIPRTPVIGRTGTLALLGIGGAFFLGSKGGYFTDVLEGVGEGGLTLMGYLQGVQQFETVGALPGGYGSSVEDAILAASMDGAPYEEVSGYSAQEYDDGMGE